MKKWVKGILALSIIAGIGFGGNYLWSKTNHSRLDDSSIEADADVEGASSLTLQPVDENGKDITNPIPVVLGNVKIESGDTYKSVLDKVSSDGEQINYLEALKHFSLVNNNSGEAELYAGVLNDHVKDKYGENTLNVAKGITLIENLKGNGYTLNSDALNLKLGDQITENNGVLKVPFTKNDIKAKITAHIEVQGTYHTQSYDYWVSKDQVIDLEYSQANNEMNSSLSNTKLKIGSSSNHEYDVFNMSEDALEKLEKATIEYIMPEGHESKAPDKLEVPGYPKFQCKIDSPVIEGYVTDQKIVEIDFKKEQRDFQVVYTEEKGDNTGTGGETVTGGGSSDVDSGDKDTDTNVDNDEKSTNTGNNNTTTNTNNVTKSVTPFKVYGKQKLYRYSHANFTNKRRVQAHAKKVKAHAPVFTVVGKTTASNGAARYKLSDGTHITASSKYVGKLYWNGSYKKLHVTNPKGINTYKTNALSGKVKHVKQGSTVAVKQISKKNGMTRYQLANGKYISGSKKLVSPTKPKQVKKVKAKTTVRLYKDVDLKKVVKTYKKGSVINVKGWDHSHGNVHHVSGYKRYKVAGGYITANSKYVKIAQ
ncbi:DUF5776 domain-containing protein [Levilactobacillus wangkuiensis]|uniref:DUF5776 domain-containing protein n=1 Tax=Levilactobacillus wangkuiensis TaxID=2799566 RepID=UPI00194FFBBC|nr:DUF5776 domain-containing protein [Levilactobacillus wangkuiensis]